VEFDVKKDLVTSAALPDVALGGRSYAPKVGTKADGIEIGPFLSSKIRVQLSIFKP
jgi:hypothetical protein